MTVAQSLSIYFLAVLTSVSLAFGTPGLVFAAAVFAVVFPVICMKIVLTASKP